ncbi:hypothetical protein [Mycolicibacterium gadium]|nr:hypothetical protein [Mycolicibacterium gadium]
MKFSLRGDHSTGHGAKVAVAMALIGDDGPTAELVGDTGAVYPW